MIVRSKYLMVPILLTIIEITLGEESLEEHKIIEVKILVVIFRAILEGMIKAVVVDQSQV